MRSPSIRPTSKRPRVDEEDDLEDSLNKPAKRRGNPVEVTMEEEEIYESQVVLLQEECDKDAPQCAVLKSIMLKTLNVRRQWIVADAPSVANVLQKFPPLRLGIKHVSLMEKLHFSPRKQNISSCTFL